MGFSLPMAKLADIPYLIHLLDDESDTVREHVRKQLKLLGRRHEAELRDRIQTLTQPQQKDLKTILFELREENYETHGWDWLEIEDERKAQEEALTWLSYLGSEAEDQDLSQQLDQLTEKYLSGKRKHNLVSSLFWFLFEEESFSAPKDQFYHPENSNLVRVIQRKKGLQISLSMIAVCMARRLDMPLYGFNMPGHFLIMQDLGNDYRVYDPFSKGESIPKQTITYIQRMMSQRSRPQMIGKASTDQIVMRVFRNLLNSYQRQENNLMYERYQEKFNELKVRIKERR